MNAGFTQGAADPDLRLKGEILCSLSAWQAEYGASGLIAWTVAQMLLKHTAREQPLDVYIEFIDRFAGVMADEATQLRQVVAEAGRRRTH